MIQDRWYRFERDQSPDSMPCHKRAGNYMKFTKNYRHFDMTLGQVWKKIQHETPKLYADIVADKSFRDFSDPEDGYPLHCTRKAWALMRKKQKKEELEAELAAQDLLDEEGNSAIDESSLGIPLDQYMREMDDKAQHNANALAIPAGSAQDSRG